MFDYDDVPFIRHGDDGCFEIAFQFDGDLHLRDIDVGPCHDCDWDDDIGY